MVFLRISSCLLFVVGSTLSAQATSSNRFRDPQGITADPTGLRRDTIARPFPHYPLDLFTRGISGGSVVAFVIDTTGRVELATASFVRTSRPEFTKAVCQLLPKLRFQPFMVLDQKWRVLLVESFAFNTGFDPDTAGNKLAAATQEGFATKPIAKVLAELETLPHCSPSDIR